MNGGSSAVTAYSAQAVQPQWSPPVNGGSRRLVITGLKVAARVPQWSPPVNGGSRARKFRAV